MPPALDDLLRSGLSELELDPPDDALAQLVTLTQAVWEWGQRINLTGHGDPETIARRLVLDAAALLTVLPPFHRIADLGAGAGFPGLPLAILAPTRAVVLVESRERRHFFQREVIRRLGLQSRVEALRGRFDEMTPEPCDAVTAQAVAHPEALLASLLRWATPGAWLIVPGGDHARGVAPETGLVDVQSTSYQVPLGGPRRTVWLARVPDSSQEAISSP